MQAHSTSTCLAQMARPIWVDVLGAPLHNPTGESVGIVGTFRASEKQG